MKNVTVVMLALLALVIAPRALVALDVGNARLEINQTEPINFPASLEISGVLSGKVVVVLSVDAEGKLVDHLVVAYTHPEFAEAAVRAIKTWTFEPLRERGRARATRVDLAITFQSGLVASVHSIDEVFIDRMRMENYSYKACALRDLDRIPTPTQVVRPSVSEERLPPGTDRTVTVEFYIDQEGRVRVPSISHEDANDLLAAAAVAAVEQWKFEPPLRRGQPVLVLVEQDFRFVGKPH